VVELFAAADLTDRAFFDADGDTAKLVRILRHQMEEKRSRVGLSAEAERYADILIAECCDCYVRIVVSLAAFPPHGRFKIE